MPRCGKYYPKKTDSSSKLLQVKGKMVPGKKAQKTKNLSPKKSNNYSEPFLNNMDIDGWYVNSFIFTSTFGHCSTCQVHSFGPGD